MGTLTGIAPVESTPSGRWAATVRGGFPDDFQPANVHGVRSVVDFLMQRTSPAPRWHGCPPDLRWRTACLSCTMDVKAATASRKSRLRPQSADVCEYCRCPQPCLARWVNAGLARLTGRQPMLSPGKVRELRHPCWVCNNGAITKAFGWVPEIPLREGIAGLYR